MKFILTVIVALTLFAILSHRVNTDNTIQIIALYLIGAGALLYVLGIPTHVAMRGLSIVPHLLCLLLRCVAPLVFPTVQ